MNRIERPLGLVRSRTTSRLWLAVLTSAAIPVAMLASLPCAYADTSAVSAQVPATLVTYADASPGYVLSTRSDAVQSVAPIGKAAVRAEVVGQLRQTVHDSELADLRDIYTHP